jgi:hypothetical protein
MGGRAAKVDMYESPRQRWVPTSKRDMIMIDRLIRTARQAVTRKRGQDFVADIISGPDTTFRSELIEVMSRTR